MYIKEPVAVIKLTLNYNEGESKQNLNFHSSNTVTRDEKGEK